MTCDRYQNLLLDLACGEAPSPELSDARAHAQTCAECGALLRKLERGVRWMVALPTVEPSPAISDHIMQRARAHTLAARALSPVDLRERQTGRTLGDRLREFLGQFAMGRQVAMASVMVLVAAVGLWFVPKARHHELAGGNVVNPDPEGEAGPSDGIVPAEPLDLDLRQGRIRARGGEPPTRAKEVAAAAPIAPMTVPNDDLAEPGTYDEGTAAKASAEEAPLVEGAAALADDRAQARTAEYEALAEQDSERKSRDDAPQEREAVASARDNAVAQPQTFAEPAPSTPSAARSAPSANRDAPELNPYAGFAPPPSSAPARSRASTAGAGLGSAEAATTEATAGDGTTKGASELVAARAARQRGQCDVAVSHFENYLRTAPRNRAVMLEAAACYRQVGRNVDAERWITRANAITDTPTSPKGAMKKVEQALPTQAQ